MSGNGTKLFVYGVHNSCPKSVLEDEFGRSGVVEDIYITGKGYAFITMANDDDARAAVSDLNGSTLDGQEIKVEIAHGKGSRGGGGGDRDRDGGRHGGGGGGGRSRGGGGDRDRGGYRSNNMRGSDRDRQGDGGGGRRSDGGRSKPY